MLKHERGRKNTTFLLCNIMGKLFEYSFPYTLHNENLIILDLKCVPFLPAKNCKMSNVNMVSYHVWVEGTLIDDKTYLTLIVRACK